MFRKAIYYKRIGDCKSSEFDELVSAINSLNINSMGFVSYVKRDSEKGKVIVGFFPYKIRAKLTQQQKEEYQAFYDAVKILLPDNVVRGGHVELITIEMKDDKTEIEKIVARLVESAQQTPEAKQGPGK